VDGTLDLKTGRDLTDAAMAKAQEIGIPISVAIVDAGGRVRLITRMDNAGWFSAEIALGKAVAAVAFRRDTDAMLDRLKGKEVMATAVTSLSGGTLILGQGGCIITGSDESVVGGIGVSGGSSQQDAECAHAAIDSVTQSGSD
jgi:glc operon protein GlcG